MIHLKIKHSTTKTFGKCVTFLKVLRKKYYYYKCFALRTIKLDSRGMVWSQSSHQVHLLTPDGTDCFHKIDQELFVHIRRKDSRRFFKTFLCLQALKFLPSAVAMQCLFLSISLRKRSFSWYRFSRNTFKASLLSSKFVQGL